ncbi:MAG: NAD-dependent epimerase/dehydratase family protein [Planctomycetota bacterium]
MNDSTTAHAAPLGKALVTGATGMLGSHIAEQLRERGVEVLALCRPGSDTSFLRGIGVRLVHGDLSDPALLRAACAGADTIYHSAAQVGDWGKWSDFVRSTIHGTRNMLDAAAAVGVRRFLYISSISAYGHINQQGVVLDEEAPLGERFNRWSYYSRAKREAERLVWAAHEKGAVSVTVIRPSWLYGSRDRASLPRMVDSIRRGKLKLVSGGRNRLNVTNAANVAEAAILAAGSARAIGEAYNACHDGHLTQREYFNQIARAIGEPELTRSVPYFLAYNFAFLLEIVGHLLRRKSPPLVTRYAVWLLGRRCFFECEKIKRHLGWKSTIQYEEGIRAAALEVAGEVESPTPAEAPARVPEMKPGI